MDHSQLRNTEIKIEERACCTMVAVSGGYPGNYAKGKQIIFDNTNKCDSIIFHAGTQMQDNAVVTSGGRVLAVTSFGNTISEAAQQSKQVLEQIHFDGMYYRKDIGYEFS